MKKLLIPVILTISPVLSEDKELSYIDNLVESTNEYRKSLHKNLVNLSSNVDNYFDETKIKNENYDGTYALVELSAFHNQHETINFSSKLKIKLKLPKLKENFRLELESDEVNPNKDFVENHKSNENNDFNLAIAYDKITKDDIRIKAKTGLKLKSKIDPFIQIKMTKEWKDIKGIDYTISQKFKQSVIKKLEATSSLRIDKILTNKLSLHNYNQYYWQSSQRPDSEFYNSIYLNQKIDSKNFLTYTIGASTNNIDSNMQIKRYSAQVKYRHYLKKWLYIDTIPENFYKEEDNFKPRYAIRFNLGMYINKDSYK